MIYAKIKSDGTVEKFPFNSPELNLLAPNAELPDDVVEVNAEKNKPALKWDEKVLYDSVEKVDDEYVLVYSNPVPKYATEDQKLKAITEIKKQYTQMNEKTFIYKTKQLKENYTDAESESWTIQRSEALLYTEDNTSVVPLLTSISNARGISLAELVEKVINNINEYDVAYGTLLGKYQKNKDLLTSIDLEDPLTWDNIDLIERL